MPEGRQMRWERKGSHGGGILQSLEAAEEGKKGRKGGKGMKHTRSTVEELASG